MSKRNKKSRAFFYGFCGVVSFSKPAKRRKRKQSVEVIDIPEVFPRVREVKPKEQLAFAKARLFGSNSVGMGQYSNAVSDTTPGLLFKPLSLFEAEALKFRPYESHRQFFRLRVHGLGGYLAGRFEPGGDIHLVHESFLVPDPSARI